MKLCTLFLLTMLAVPASTLSAAPVHIALQSAAAVSPNADGFFTLAAVASLSGGEAAQRTRLSAIIVGRAPLCGETRRLNPGDIALKLRQAGFDPDKDVALDGAEQASVTTVGAGLAPAPILGSQAKAEKQEVLGTAANPAPQNWGGGASLLRPGAPVTILIQSGALTITAPGIARTGGGAGDSIRVHRDGVMTDLTVTVLDAQTVRLEI